MRERVSRRIKISNGKLQRVAPVGAYREIFMDRLPLGFRKAAQEGERVEFTR